MRTILTGFLLSSLFLIIHIVGLPFADKYGLSLFDFLALGVCFAIVDLTHHWRADE